MAHLTRARPLIPFLLNGRRFKRMAIPPSKLSDFIGSCSSTSEVYEKLRSSGLLWDEAPETDVRRMIDEALTTEADEISRLGFTWASAATRLPHILAEAGYLSAKGLKWRVPYRGFSNPADLEPRIYVERRLLAADVRSLAAMLDQKAARLDALWALERKGTQAAAAVPRLVKLLTERDQLVVCATLKTLRAIGPEAQNAIPALTRLVNDADSLVRLQARATVKAICPELAEQFWTKQ